MTAAATLLQLLKYDPDYEQHTERERERERESESWAPRNAEYNNINVFAYESADQLVLPPASSPLSGGSKRHPHCADLNLDTAGHGKGAVRPREHGSLPLPLLPYHSPQNILLTTFPPRS